MSQTASVVTAYRYNSQHKENFQLECKISDCCMCDHKTKSPAVSRIADRTGCQWHSKSSKIDDFRVIWKGVCHFLLVINSNLGLIFNHFQDTVTYSLKLSVENWVQTAADGDMITTDSLYEVASALSDGTIADPNDLPFSHNTARLAYHSALWLFKII